MDVETEKNDEEMELMFDNLEEWLNDEDKVVTYRWLSLTLNLHVNYAKHVLDAFVKSERGRKLALNVNYCLFGYVLNSGIKMYQVTVVPDEERETMTATMLSPVSSHIYSIQKTRLQNPDILYAADFDLIKSCGLSAVKLSAIECLAAKLTQCTQRINKSTSGNLQLLQTAKSTTAVKNSQDRPVTTNLLTDKTTSKSKSSSAFGRMFGNASRQKTESSAVQCSGAVSHGAVSSGAASSGAVSSVAASSGAASKCSPDTKFTKLTQVKSTNSVPTKSDSKTQHEQQKHSENIGSGKRRRIVQLSSSDDDEVLSIGESSPEHSPPTAVSSQPQTTNLPHDEEPMETATDESHSRPQANDAVHSGPQQIMQRKLVSKTYVNEEGFMVTEKVWESAMVQSVEKSNNAQTVAPPAIAASLLQHKKNTNKKSTSSAVPSTTKQSSLTKFFQKK